MVLVGGEKSDEGMSRMENICSYKYTQGHRTDFNKHVLYLLAIAHNQTVILLPNKVMTQFYQTNIVGPSWLKHNTTYEFLEGKSTYFLISLNI